MVKKIWGIVLCCMLLWTASVPAWAAEANLVVPTVSNISSEQAIVSLHKVFPELTKGKTFRSVLEPDRGMGEAVWVLTWYSDEYANDDRGYRGTPGITAEVKASNGDLLSVNYRPDANKLTNKAIALTKSQAYQAAWKIVKQLHSDKLDQLRYQNEVDNYQVYYGGAMATSYTFNWGRVLAGNTIDTDMISISIDARNGVLTNYRCNWHAKQLPAMGQVMSVTDLTNKVISEVGMYLTYMEDPQNRLSGNGVPQLVPVYAVNSAYASIDAYTGKWLNYDGSEAQGNMRAVTGDFQLKPGVGTVAEPAPSKEFVSPEAALKTAEEFFRYLGIEGKVRRSGSGSSSGPGGYQRTTWGYSLDNSGRYGREPLSVDIDANTGKIVSFYRYLEPNLNSTSKLTYDTAAYDKAVKAAQEMIAKLNPELMDMVTLQTNAGYSGKDPNYNIGFIRVINGIPYSGNTIYVGVDKSTGIITNYHVYWPPVQVKTDKINLTLEQAVEKFRSNPPWKLSYIFPRNEQGEELGTGVAVYRMQDKSAVDAVSGDLVGYAWGMNQDNQIPPEEEFKGVAAPALSLLKQNGLLPEGMTNTQISVTRRQALKVVVAATRSNMGYGDDDLAKLRISDIKAEDPDMRVFQTAVKLGIIANQGKFEPGQPLTREELAVWLIKGLGYQQVAQIQNPITLPLKDAVKIQPTRRNHVGIAWGLGLLNGDQKAFFNPQRPVTWDELAVAATKAAAEAQIVNQRYTW